MFRKLTIDHIIIVSPNVNVDKFKNKKFLFLLSNTKKSRKCTNKMDIKLI